MSSATPTSPTLLFLENSPCSHNVLFPPLNAYWAHHPEGLALSAETLVSTATRLTSSTPSNLCSDITFLMRPTPIKKKKKKKSQLCPGSHIPDSLTLHYCLQNLSPYLWCCLAWLDCKVHESMRMDVFVLIPIIPIICKKWIVQSNSSVSICWMNERNPFTPTSNQGWLLD